MNRYRQYGQLDDFPEVFGDVQFTRLDMKTDPATLPAGAVQVSENLRMDANGITVRGGISRQFLAGTYIGTIVKSGIYRPDGAEDRLVFITFNRMWLFNPADQTLAMYPLPAGETFLPGDTVDLVQGGIGAGTLPRLFIFHGLDNNTLSFDGAVVTVGTHIPKASIGLFYQNRLAVASGAQNISTSDFLAFDLDANWNLLNQFQIEKGGADYLVGFMAYQGDYVLIGTRKKWFVAYFDPGLGTNSPYTGALSNQSWLRLLTAEAGPVGREAMLAAAGMIWFVSDSGIYAFAPNLNNELVPLGRPLSAEILPAFSRMNGAAASGATIAQFGYRIYFALPISDVPVAITNFSAVNHYTNGVVLPQTLPFLLTQGAIATITTGTAHGLSAGDMVQLSGLMSGSLNTSWPVLAVIDTLNFQVAIPTSTGAVLTGQRATAQRLAMRNNLIAVLNTSNRDAEHPLGVWESLDTLPQGFYADALRIADYGPQRRLWIVDAVRGPALYEQGAVDEVGDVVGGVALPFTLPVTLYPANFASVPVAGRLVSRAYRWEGTLGSPHGTIAYNRRVRASEVRLATRTGDAATVICRVRIPGRLQQEYTQTFTADPNQPDAAVYQRVSARGLEAEVEVQATSGQPTIRSLEIQVMKSGTY